MKKMLIVVVVAFSLELRADSVINVFGKTITFSQWEIVLPQDMPNVSGLKIDLSGECSQQDCYSTVLIGNYTETEKEGLKELPGTYHDFSVCGLHVMQVSTNYVKHTIISKFGFDYSLYHVGDKDTDKSLLQMLCEGSLR
ncbi:hypothetical protein [Neptuniibacter sp. QD34_54]|uniref:hypothetical protein n=1 Tax=Neptuniibacter sp. QD34_54 TaxID=3398208 RepID=UPI0039F5D627